MDKQYTKAFVEKAEDDTLEVAIASTSDEDREGDSLPVDSWELGNFQKNPVLLDMHMAERSSTSVIGRVEKIWKEGNKLLFRPRFATKENPRAKVIRDLYKNGFMHAFSVGFRPYKEGDEIKNELLEISTVPVPMHQDAIVVMRSYGITPKSWNGEELKNTDEEIESYRKKLKADLKSLQTKFHYAKLKRKKEALERLNNY